MHVPMPIKRVVDYNVEVRVRLRYPAGYASCTVPRRHAAGRSAPAGGLPHRHCGDRIRTPLRASFIRRQRTRMRKTRVDKTLLTERSAGLSPAAGTQAAGSL